MPMLYDNNENIFTRGLNDRLPKNLPPGTRSDDTSLALCLAGSLICGFATGGISTVKAIAKLKAGIAPENPDAPG
jgi:ADP-ribosylglycohydrolase